MLAARLKALHFWFGVLAVMAFLATGQFMYHAYDQLQGMADGPRLLFRSSHLYILLSAIPHLMLGVYLEPAGVARFGRIQLPMSLLLVAATLLMAAGATVGGAVPSTDPGGGHRLIGRRAAGDRVTLAP
ncbi:MAG: hypothetical protein AABY62_10505 [Pseudomonadota bacterium]